jgi:hypothetical protein
MDFTVIKAKIAAGVLPPRNGVAVRQARYVSGVCVGCGATFGASDVGVEFFLFGRGRRFLHADCYVMWTEACAETVAALALCRVAVEMEVGLDETSARRGGHHIGGVATYPA